MIALLHQSNWNPYKMFHMADANGDGKLTRIELKEWIPKQYHRPIDDVYNNLAIFRNRLDPVFDYFTMSEASNIIFTALEKSGDGNLDRREIAKGVNIFAVNMGLQKFDLSSLIKWLGDIDTRTFPYSINRPDFVNRASRIFTNFNGT